MKELWAKHKTLLKGALLLIIVVLIWGALLISDSIEKSNDKVNTYEISSKDTSIRTYNVEGLTQEEINELINEIHLNDLED